MVNESIPMDDDDKKKRKEINLNIITKTEKLKSTTMYFVHM
jgi:hypothetical protein